jgi:diguanylate cyclase (GGDEF)-like protein/PAS domain S-box-containing protein
MFARAATAGGFALPTTRRSPGRAWLFFLLAACALGGLAVSGYRTPVDAGIVFDAVGAASVVAIGFAIVWNREARLAWCSIAAGLAAFVAGRFLAHDYRRLFGVPFTHPWLANGSHLAAYPLLAVGLTLLMRARTPGRDRTALLDALIVATSVGAISWTLLMSPYSNDGALAWSTKLTALAYPVLDLVVGVSLLRLVFAPGRRLPASFLLLTTGVLLLVVTDSLNRWGRLHGGFRSGGWVGSGWILFFALVGAAALHPSASELVTRAPEKPFHLTPARLAILASSACVVPAFLAAGGAATSEIPLLAAFAGVVFLLVCLRLLDLGGRHGSALERATVLARAGVGLVEARAADDVAAVASAAGQQLLGESTTVTIRGAEEAPEDAVALPLQGRGESHGVLVFETPQRVDADRFEALRTLSNSVALALDGVRVSEQLLRKRTEARFRALVQHSSDAILVLDSAGSIDYASPSTVRVLGMSPEDLQGRSFVELVVDHDRPRIAQALAAGHADGPMQALELELVTSRGTLEVEATCTNLLDTDEIRGIVLNLRDVSERKDFERQLAHKAFHDELTGLANRVLFRDRVEHALARVSRGASIAVLFLDLDDFKAVNDALGHQAGDELIRVVAGRLAASARTTDTASRLGGDEFAVLIEDDDGDNADLIAQRLLEGIAAPIQIDGRELAMTASIGIARVEPGEPIHVDNLMRNADVAMYAAKSSGKGTCRRFASEMHTALLDRLELKRELQTAIERGEFELRYQPVVDLETGEFCSLEALIRWNHPTRGFVAPDAFIPIAEETGAIVAIGRWALRTACRKAARIQQLVGPAAPTIAVNISGRQLQDASLVDDTIRILLETALAPEKLVLEITETVMISDFELALDRLGELRRHKIRVAVDDFGSGYSSLNYIRRLPIDILKIDREFIADINESAEVAALAETILGLARILGVTPVAEGIENAEQLAMLKGLGCTLGQGYLFMRPVDGDEIEREVVKQAMARRAAMIA